MHFLRFLDQKKEKTTYRGRMDPGVCKKEPRPCRKDMYRAIPASPSGLGKGEGKTQSPKTSLCKGRQTRSAGQPEAVPKKVKPES